MTVFTTMNELKKTQISDMLAQGKRVDGRALDDTGHLNETVVIPKQTVQLVYAWDSE